MNPNLRQVIVIACAVFAAVVAIFVFGDAGFVKDDPAKWLAGAVLVAAIGLGILAAP